VVPIRPPWAGVNLRRARGRAASVERGFASLIDRWCTFQHVTAGPQIGNIVETILALAQFEYGKPHTKDVEPTSRILCFIPSSVTTRPSHILSFAIGYCDMVCVHLRGIRTNVRD